nr:uncharacterized protein LOC109163845 [Ipomoea batatas]
MNVTTSSFRTGYLFHRSVVVSLLSETIMGEAIERIQLWSHITDFSWTLEKTQSADEDGTGVSTRDDPSELRRFLWQFGDDEGAFKLGAPSSLAMAAWPPINNRSTPIDNTTGNPAGNQTGNTAPSSSAPAATPATRSTATEVTYDPLTQSNPYFLHINENPALELVSYPLDGSNYHPWARAMTMALSCKNKIPFINGTIQKPSENDLEKYLVWERCNNMVKSWIVRTLSPSIGSSVLWIETAHGVWNDLKRRFSKQDLFRIAEVKSNCFDLLHVDIWGPYKVATIHGHHYFLTILDDHSRAVWVYMMKMKYEVRDLITGFCKLVENQFASSVKCIRSDNGWEFNMEEFFTAISDQIPYQVLLKRVPQYQNLKVFGCLAYATIVSPKSKLDARAKKCVFLGCATTTKGYKVYDLVSKKLLLSRDVIFYEHIFPFQHDTVHKERITQIILPSMNEIPIEVSDVMQPQNQVRTNDENSCGLGPLSEETSEPSPGMANHQVNPSVNTDQQITRRSTRQKHTPTYLQDYVCHNLKVRTSPHTMNKVMDYSKLDPSFQSFIIVKRSKNVNIMRDIVMGWDLFFNKQGG